MGKILLHGNQTSFLQISLFEIGATVAQLVVSGRKFGPQDGPRYFHHDLAVLIYRYLHQKISSIE